MLEPYIKNCLISLQENFNYRADFLIRFFTGFLYAYAKVAIWYAIINANKSSLNAALAGDTVKYMILASVISMVLASLPTEEITRRIITGEIGRDLIYPVSLPVSLFFRCLGNALAVIITRVIPTLVVLTITYRPDWNLNPVSLAELLLSLLVGFYLYFLMNLLVDMVSFWVVESYSFSTIKFAAFSVLSGSLVPLWFYPNWFLKIIDWLPFRNMVYTPLAFYFNRIPQAQFLNQIAISLFWMVFMTGLACILWKAGTKKVVVQGG